nr:MAG TPA: hypothetical protein [Caudoviricetes sp.]
MNNLLAIHPSLVPFAIYLILFLIGSIIILWHKNEKD